MKVLFDQGTPVPLRSFLVGHDVLTAFELGWSGLKNGELLSQAEDKFDAIITTHQNLRYQQNLTGRNLAILVLPTTSWPILSRFTGVILFELNNIKSGGYCEITLPSA